MLPRRRPFFDQEADDYDNLELHDIIGDIHGHAGALRALLAKLGYQERDGTYRHADRQALYVGDFIDRGPQQVETVKTSCDAWSMRVPLKRSWATMNSTPLPGIRPTL